MYTGDAAAQIWVRVCDKCGALVLDGEVDGHNKVLHSSKSE
jgi:hypothetical protein